MNIDEMETGRELDALIAEKVMDCKIAWDIYNGRRELFCHCPGNKHEQRCSYAYRMSHHYSTDIAAAWEVVEKLNSMKLGWFSLEQFGEKGQGRWRAMIWMGGEEIDASFFADADTIPLAICRTALKAVMTDDAQPA